MSGRVYSVFSPSFNPTGAARHLLRILAAAEHPLEVKRLWLNTEATSANVIDLVLNRVTDAGTETGNCTATPMSQNAPAFTGDHGYFLTVAPTVSVEVMRWKWDLQVPFEWVFGPGEELLIPGATNEGFSLECEDDYNFNTIVGAIIGEN